MRELFGPHRCPLLCPVVPLPLLAARLVSPFLILPQVPKGRIEIEIMISIESMKRVSDNDPTPGRFQPPSPLKNGYSDLFQR